MGHRSAGEGRAGLASFAKAPGVTGVNPGTAQSKETRRTSRKQKGIPRRSGGTDVIPLGGHRVRCEGFGVPAHSLGGQQLGRKVKRDTVLPQF